MAIRLRSFRAAGYKAFPLQAPPLELAPITLVIGHNNAGKSSLVRAPILFADSLGDENEVLALSTRGLDFARDPAELFNEPAHGTLEFGFDLVLSDEPTEPEERGISLSFELGLVSTATTRPRLVVRSVAVDSKENQLFPGLPLGVHLRGGR